MARDSQFDSDLLRILNTDAGLAVFRQLVKDFGFHNSSVTLSSTGEVNTTAMINNEAIRTFWVNLRKHIPYEKLILIEYDTPEHKEVEKCQTDKMEQMQQAQQTQQTPRTETQGRRASARREALKAEFNKI